MNPEKIIEALIFISENPLKPAHINEIFKGEDYQQVEMSEDLAKQLLESIAEKYEASESPWELRRIGGGYQFLTRKEYFPYLKSAVLHRNHRKLSRVALETLSIIAYRQPVTKTEIEFIRGVNCDYAIQKLLDKNLIEIAGRSDAPGRPLIYKTSAFFFEYFSINNINDLPKLQEITIDEDEYQKQFQTFLEENEDLKSHVEEGRLKNNDAPSDENTVDENHTISAGFTAASAELFEMDEEPESSPENPILPE